MTRNLATIFCVALGVIGFCDASAADPIVLGARVAPGAHFVFRGQDLPWFTIEVDTIAGVMRIDGFQVVGERALSEDECLDRWGKVAFVSGEMAKGKDCVEAQREYNAAVKSCLRRLRQVVDDSSLVAGKNDEVLKGLLWANIDADSVQPIVKEISVEGGLARVQMVGASRSIAIIPRSAIAARESNTTGPSSGSNLIAFATSIVRKVELPRAKPFLVAVTTSGGIIECSGREPVGEALRQVADFSKSGEISQGPLTEECLR